MHNSQNNPANRLIHETSPYLLQHARNPVDWHAWNEETLAKAKRENKMLLISIGYSACHWCHVMERESFENKDVAGIMNENFINVKVDREERPDVDAIYMQAVQLLHGSGGWPLNCFALPDGRPFYGGTYFPPDQWKTLLANVARLFDEQRDDLEEQARRVTAGLQTDDLMQFREQPGEGFDQEVENKAVEKWKERFDHEHGGFQGAPKFPMPNNILFLLRHAYLKQDPALRQFVELTLDRMAAGGIYDQLGGGFARYATDENWKIPHFEKMLYDNAQLISLYAEAFRFTKNEDYLRVAKETADWALREMLSPDGLFYAALDADSEGEEGKFYVWTRREIDEVLGEDAGPVADFYGIGGPAHWEEGKNILIKTMDHQSFAKMNGIQPADFEKILNHSRQRLLEKRNQRARPGIDDKMITSWNALMAGALAELFLVSGEENYRKTALKVGQAIMDRLFRQEGSLYHTYQKGHAAIDGFLDDYAFSADAFLKLSLISGNDEWLHHAEKLAGYAIANFQDRRDGYFWFTDQKSHNLVARKKEVLDQVIPSANSSMAHVLFELGKIFENRGYIDMAKQMVAALGKSITQYPGAFSNWAMLHQHLSGSFYEIVIAGPEAVPKAAALFMHYHPLEIMLTGRRRSDVPIFMDRYRDDRTLIYVCVNNTCKQPVERVEDAAELIR